MMSSLTNLKAIASVQNVEQKQISDSTGSTIQLGGNKITDTDLKKLSNDKISKDNTKDNFNKLLNQVKNKKNEITVENKKSSKVNNKEKTKVKSEDINDEDIKERIKDLTDEQ